jgi:predicted hotdog family 3-hydroxylacyl-ACP dehydratase
MRLDRTWIEQNIPHHGRMCLLDEVIEWDAEHIRCRSGTHRLPDHPLRSRGRLGIACGIEYAAQAMAVHGALAGVAFVASGATAVGTLGAVPLADSARKGNARPEAGLLAGLRDIRMHVLRLDNIETDLICDAALVAGDRCTALYEFALRSGTRRLLSGRATVVFDSGVLSRK